MTPQALPLEDAPTVPLREAYNRTPSINTRYTFGQAQAIKPLAIALRCYAEAITRGKK